MKYLAKIGLNAKKAFEELKGVKHSQIKLVLANYNKSILKKLIHTKKVRSKIIKLKQDIDKPDFGRN